MRLLEQLATGMGTDVAYVEKLCRTASSHYRIATIPKKNGGQRVIWMPSPELKAAQRFLVRNVLNGLRVHAAARAYEPRATIRENARLHAGSQYLLRMDFRRFFESITRDDVCAFIAEVGSSIHPRWSDDDTRVFADLVCWRNHLVIGAVTSPSLTNRMCFGLDVQLATACDAAHVAYSRYADDLFFSTTLPDVLHALEQTVTEIVRALKQPASLRLNTRKTRHSSKVRRRVVTGLILTCEGALSVGRDKKRKIRAMIHRLEALSQSDRLWLKGTLGFCRDVEPGFVDRLVLKYGAERMGLAISSP